jgi:hypothetical protein
MQDSPWLWDYKQRSSNIHITNLGHSLSSTSGELAYVVGNTSFREGKIKWNLKIEPHSPQEDLVYVGVIDEKFLKDASLETADSKKLKLEEYLFERSLIISNSYYRSNDVQLGAGVMALLISSGNSLFHFSLDFDEADKMAIENEDHLQYYKKGIKGSILYPICFLKKSNLIVSLSN